jgi:hypothetical protein
MQLVQNIRSTKISRKEIHTFLPVLD